MKEFARNASKYLKWEIPSSLETIESLCVGMRCALETRYVSHRCFAIELLAREGLANALTHGNRNSVDKSIVLQLWIGRKWVRLRVSDQGTGFAWRTARFRNMDVGAVSGRGLHVYRAYAERIRFNRRGNQVTFWIGRTRGTDFEEDSENNVP